MFTKLSLTNYQVVVIGVSAGGMQALTQILSELKSDFPLPILIVQHLHPKQGNFHIEYFNKCSALKVKEAEEKEKITQSVIYFAPPNYHLLVEDDFTFSLSADEKVNYCRPAVDVLFDSILDAYQEKVIGIILTGANNDGAASLARLQKIGALAIIQDPKEAEFSAMPLFAVQATKNSTILKLKEIAELLNKMQANTPKNKEK